jgi:hypothetical protein
VFALGSWCRLQFRQLSKKMILSPCLLPSFVTCYLLSECLLWAVDVDYSFGDYLKNSSGHPAYYPVLLPTTFWASVCFGQLM